MSVRARIACLIALMIPVAVAADLKPLIENERVIVWDVPAGQSLPEAVTHHEYDVVKVSFTRGAGTAVFEKKGGKTSAAPATMQTMVIALKDHAAPPIPNKTGLPSAFPRPGVKKLIDNDRIVTWEYTWQPNVPTPTHFHDKDVVLVYLEDGSLKSTTPDGKSVINDYTYGQIKFNPGNRSHTELLVKGQQHAIMTELK
ncbi:MAG TPA: hypothetical protein VGF16_00750 [Bryobacteraceae bacterium]|jgi:hypothetical protein